MTVVLIGRKGKPESNMRFEFKSGMDAYHFYCIALDNYSEDDFVIAMTEE